MILDSEDNLTSDRHGQLHQLVAEFESSLDTAAPQTIEFFVDRPDTPVGLLSELLKIEVSRRIRGGEEPRLEEYLQRFPQRHLVVRDAFRAAQAASSVADQENVDDLANENTQQLFSHSRLSDAALVEQSGIGDRQFGEYKILREIAQGGMGVVYQAQHVKLGRVVALKMIRTGNLSGVAEVNRFKAESQAIAKLAHPNIVPVFDAGEVDGQPYFSMAFVEGESLAQRVQRTGPLTPEFAAKVMNQIAQALHHAHQRGIIHRDLKPHNILIDQNDHVQVTDFGLAKLQESCESLTRTGQILGTPAYMPPEQASGKLDSVDARADIYSLGATLYFLLSARPPFQASNLNEVLRQVGEVEPIALRQLDRSIPRDLETICHKAITKEPNGRYASADLLSKDLERWLRGEPIHARPAGMVERAVKWCRRKPVSAGLTAAVCVAMLLAILVVVERERRLGIQFEVDASDAAIRRNVEQGLTLCSRFLKSDDYASARSEQQKIAGLLVKLDSPQDLLEQFNRVSTELDAVTDFEIARVHRCGMPSCQFDYANFSPVAILESLALDFPDDSVDELVAKIQSSNIREEITASLDDWAWVLSESSADRYRSQLPKIVAVCNRLDAEPVRVSIREAMLEDNSKASIDIPRPAADQLSELQPAGILFLANALFKYGQPEAALGLLTDSVVVYPDDFWLNLRLAEIAKESEVGDSAVRLKHLEVARVLRPANFVVAHNVASEYAQNDRTDDALRLLTLSMKATPSDPNLRHAFALLHHTKIDEPDTAREIYEATIDLFPDFVQSYINVAGIYANQGDFANAERRIDQALALQSRKTELPNADAAETYNLALIYSVKTRIAKGKNDVNKVDEYANRAIGLYRTVLRYDRDGLYATNFTSELRFAANIAAEQEDSERQFELIKEAALTEKASDRGALLLDLASQHMSRGDMDDAVSAIAAASQALPIDDIQMAANILINAAIMHAAKAEQMRQAEGADSIAINLIEAEAVDFLRRAHAMKFFSSLPFAKMLLAREEFSPLASTKGYWEIVVESFRSGIPENPDLVADPMSSDLYFAARSAVRLSIFPIDEVETREENAPIELRLQANRWLRQKLSRLRDGVQEGGVPLATLRQALTLWQQDTGWASVRDEQALEGIDSYEAELWRGFWQSVDDLKNAPPADQVDPEKSQTG
jgi:tRNA A-37 threonylcarbamoyl transferase component Bud32/tetratricopeptide (TPR) repeat protein